MILTEVAEDEIILEFLLETKDYLQNYLKTNDRNATGKTSASITEEDVTDRGGRLVGPTHTLFTFSGRAPGTMPPLSQIVDWCAARNIPRSAAWPIAYKIKMEGTKLFREGGREDNALIDVTTPEKIQTLVDRISDTYLVRTNSDVVKLIKQ